MYGVPQASDLSFLLQKELQQVCIGQHEIILHFCPDTSITLQCDYDVVSNHGSGPDEKVKLLVGLLGDRIVKVETEGRKTIVLHFSGKRLLIHDNDANYESFVIVDPQHHIVV